MVQLQLLTDIFNFSSCFVNEKLVLPRGLNFCVPFRGTNSADVFAEIELYVQLKRHSLAPAANIA